MIPFLTSFFLPFFFLASFPAPTLAQSKQIWDKNDQNPYELVIPEPEAWRRKLAEWNPIFEKSELDGWYCATKNTEIKNNVPKLEYGSGIEINEDGIYIGAQLPVRNGKMFIIPIQLLVPLKMKEIIEYKIIAQSLNTVESCAQNDNKLYFTQQNQVYRKNVPYCKRTTKEPEVLMGENRAIDGVKFEYDCSEFVVISEGEFSELWQPKKLANDVPASAEFGIYAISLAKDPNLKGCSGVTIMYYPSPDYRFLVHKDDVEPGTELDDCLNRGPPTTTTETTTTTTRKTTTKKMPIKKTTKTPPKRKTTTAPMPTTPPTTSSATTTATTKTTKWKLVTNLIEFMPPDGPTPFPDDAVVELD